MRRAIRLPSLRCRTGRHQFCHNAFPLQTNVDRMRMVRRFSNTVVSASSVALISLREADIKSWSVSPNTATMTPSISIHDYCRQFSSLPPATRHPDDTHRLVGRVTARRSASSKLCFFTIRQDTAHVQLIANKMHMAESFEQCKHIRRGDIVCVDGYVGTGNTGELSLVLTNVTPLSHCQHELPVALTDIEVRHRQRYLDMIINPMTALTAITHRAKVLAAIRQTLDSRGFVEVETPILWPSANGANARPFITRSTAFGQHYPLYLRIAPELFLKQLIIGGMSRVYEMGRVFRNEGIDATHNPEFTSIEFYIANMNYRQLMTLTRQLLMEITYAVKNTYIIELTSLSTEDKQQKIDMSAEYPELDVMKTLCSKLNITHLPNPNNNINQEYYINLLHEHHITLAKPHTIARCLDRLIATYIEPLCIQPTYITHHPLCMSPLAKACIDRPEVTERFELFINGKEYINAYSELTDSVEQRRRMTLQQSMKHIDGDEECHDVDEEYCYALEYAMTPCAGWGMGVDRLCMLLQGSQHIREVTTFPIFKQNVDNPLHSVAQIKGDPVHDVHPPATPEPTQQ